MLLCAPPKVCHLVLLLSVSTYHFLGKQAATMDDDDDSFDLDHKAYREAQEAFNSPLSVEGIQHSLNQLQHRLNTTANELVVILKECQMLKVHIANLVKFQQDCGIRWWLGENQARLRSWWLVAADGTGVTGMTRTMRTTSWIVQSSFRGACTNKSVSSCVYCSI